MDLKQRKPIRGRICPQGKRGLKSQRSQTYSNLRLEAVSGAAGTLSLGFSEISAGLNRIVVQGLGSGALLPICKVQLLYSSSMSLSKLLKIPMTQFPLS